VSRSYLSQLEKGGKTGFCASLRSIADVLEIEPVELLRARRKAVGVVVAGLLKSCRRKRRYLCAGPFCSTASGGRRNFAPAGNFSPN
jgi:transcriptional regulator with XRE-family HTH domain